MTVTDVTDVTAGWSEVILAGPGREQTATLRTDCGIEVIVDVARWHAEADHADLDALGRARGPVLDVGSGPGRLVAALTGLGVTALGIDTCAMTVAGAVAAGSPMLHVDVFGDVPSAGQWATAVLFDGNIGIGGDPRRLLGRIAELVAPDGQLIVEVYPPTIRADGRQARVHHSQGTTDWFPWCVVSVSELPDHAAATGWTVGETWSRDGRWFSVLDRTQAARP